MIEAEPRGMIKILRLDRPEKRNALTPRMLASLRSHIDTSASARAIVLSGAGDIFCAGFDLSLCRDDGNAMSALLEGLSGVILSLRIAPCPVVISAHGGAIAGGCALLGAATSSTQPQPPNSGTPWFGWESLPPSAPPRSNCSSALARPGRSCSIRA